MQHNGYVECGFNAESMQMQSRISFRYHLGMVSMCVEMHQSVAGASRRFLTELSRHNYVTPTSYLELLGIFGKLIGMKISELTTNRNRMKIGLDKVRVLNFGHRHAICIVSLLYIEDVT